MKNLINGIIFVVPIKYRDMAPKGYWQGIKTTSIKYNRSGSITIQRMSHYVTLDKIIIKPYKKGFVGKGLYQKNYQPDMYYTEYYDQEGNEVNRKDLQ